MARRGTSFLTLSKIENILMFVIIWACILSIHYAYKRSGVGIFEKPGETINIAETKKTGKISMNFQDGKNNFNEVEFLQPDLAAKIQKELEESRKEQEKEMIKEAQRRKDGEFYSTVKVEEVYKWFDERPKRNDKLENSKNTHPQLPKLMIKGEKICANVRVDILFYIHSKINNVKNRDGIRKTYAHPENFKRLNIKVIFILGRGTNEEEKKKIIEESNKNGDIIQADFEDVQKNLCYKVLTFLQWIVDHCSTPTPRFIVKVDDDFFVNPFMLIEEFISEVWQKVNFVSCHAKENSPIVRNEKSKWYVPESVYPKKDPDVFPKTCSGYTAIFAGDMVPALHSVSVDTPLIPIDDAYLFSFLFGKLEDPQYIQLLDSMTLNKEAGLEDYNGKKRLQYVSVSSWGDTTDHMTTLWNATLKHLTTLGKQLINEKRLPK